MPADKPRTDRYMSARTRQATYNKWASAAAAAATTKVDLSKEADEETSPDLPEEKPDEKTEVFPVAGLDKRCTLQNLHSFEHLINDLETRRNVPDPTPKLSTFYDEHEKLAAETQSVIERETALRANITAEIQRLKSDLQQSIKAEDGSRRAYRDETVDVMRLELQEPCRFNRMYGCLQKYVSGHGHLPPLPSSCESEEDRRLSIWIQENKSLMYSKSERITNFPHRITALKAMGIDAGESDAHARWNKMFAKLELYKHQHGTAVLPTLVECRLSNDRNLITLRRWMDEQKEQVDSGSITKHMDRLGKLQDLGVPLKLSPQHEWEYYIHRLLVFRAHNGHTFVSNKYPGLHSFVLGVLEKLKKGANEKLTKDQMHDLRLKGLLFDLRSVNTRTNGRPNGPPPKTYGGGIKLALDDYEGGSNQVTEVGWSDMLSRLKAYKEENGSVDLRNEEADGPNGDLKEWLEMQLKLRQKGKLGNRRAGFLTLVGVELDPWQSMCRRLAKYKRQAGTASLPKTFRSDDPETDRELAVLCRWVWGQVKLYRKDKLEPERRKKLRALGVRFSKEALGKVHWETRFNEMVDYYLINKTCLPKRDGPLRQWVLELVEVIESGGFISNKRQTLIDEAKIAPYLKREVIFAPPKKKRKAETDDAEGSGKLKCDGV
mmetsp:Transcript_5254/g.11253  ORF Transcript_5254/g.11253 Transcript_5254/m.11253 type:complete len:661 (+) Transcript_5254:170-2152(+)